MPLDPQVEALLEARRAAGLLPVHELAVEEARVSLRSRRLHAARPQPVAAVAELLITGRGGPLPLRVYRPAGDGGWPVLVYLHGGGWVLGDLDTDDDLCRALANAARCMVVSVDYRLSPEHRFPAALDDAEAATLWVAANADQIGADARRIGIGGESAGGNLAVAVALRAREHRHPQLAVQLVMCAPLDCSFDTRSYRENAEGYLLTRATMEWFWAQYCGECAGDHPLVSPLRASELHGLPPGIVVVAEYDPLRDDGLTYARRLEEAGVPVTLHSCGGMVHGFLSMGGAVDAAAVAIREIGESLRVAMGAQPLATTP